MTRHEKQRLLDLYAKVINHDELSDSEASEFARLEQMAADRRRRIAEAVAASPMAFLGEATR